MNHIPVLIIVFPLCGAVLCPLISYFSPTWGKRAVIGALFAAFALSIMQLSGIIQTGEPVHYWMGGWAPPYGIEFVIDF